MRLVESVVRTMRVAKVYTDNQVTSKDITKNNLENMKKKNL